jgi:uncharacterized protein YgiM (DUF1202 family)
MGTKTSFTKSVRTSVLVASVALFLSSSACSPAAPSDSSSLTGVDEDIASSEEGVSGSVSVGSKLKTTANLNFRTGPSTGYKVIRVLAQGTTVEVVQSSPSNGFYKVKHSGTTGWAHGGYMQVVSSSSTSTSKRDAAVSRAKAGVGFSYWWGHARWRPSGPTSSTKGSCSGSCPSCSHSGSYGADCSGYVGKIWQVPSGNNDLTYDWHPYSTANFVKSSSLWSTVSRSNLKKADALVYNSNGAGHIVLYESGNGWGSMWAYECKGCSAGCVRNLRTASSAYKGIRRSGY